MTQAQSRCIAAVTRRRLCLGLLSIAALAQTPRPYSRTVLQNGTTVTLRVDRIDPTKAADPLREFDNVVVQLRISDTASKSPITGGSPAAWIDRRLGDQVPGRGHRPVALLDAWSLTSLTEPWGFRYVC